MATEPSGKCSYITSLTSFLLTFVLILLESPWVPFVLQIFQACFHLGLVHWLSPKTGELFTSTFIKCLLKSYCFKWVYPNCPIQVSYFPQYIHILLCPTFPFHITSHSVSSILFILQNIHLFIKLFYFCLSPLEYNCDQGKNIFLFYILISSKQLGENTGTY